jgi:hypothetical protein
MPDTPQDTYFDVITGKTAILFAAAAAAGAKLAGANDDDVAVMHDYGLQLGLAFQIMDDAMDYGVSSSAMGKNTGDDFIDQKITLPVILAWQDGDANDREFWQRTMGDGNFVRWPILPPRRPFLPAMMPLTGRLTIAGDYANAAIACAVTPVITVSKPDAHHRRACRRRQVFSSTAKLGTQSICAQTPAANKGHLFASFYGLCTRRSRAAISVARCHV